MNDIDETDALSHLDGIDAKHGVNTPAELPIVKSLGKVNLHPEDQLSSASESSWKLLSLDLILGFPYLIAKSIIIFSLPAF